MESEKKQMEARALAAARQSGLPLPSGEVIPGEEPDFRLKTDSGFIGLELTELLPLPRSSSYSSTIAEQNLHENIIQLAERAYYASNATPVKVSAFFWDIERARNKKREMADALVSL